MDNLLAAAREAWGEYKRQEDHQLDRVLTIGKAFLDVRKALLRDLGLDAPTGTRYGKALRTWREENGFGDMEPGFASNLTWLAENEDEVRAHYKRACEVRGRSTPSVEPQSLKHGVIRARTKPLYKRKSPTNRPDFLVKQLRRILDGMDQGDRIALIDELTGVIEAYINGIAEGDVEVIGDGVTGVAAA